MDRCLELQICYWKWARFVEDGLFHEGPFCIFWSCLPMLRWWRWQKHRYDWTFKIICAGYFQVSSFLVCSFCLCDLPPWIPSSMPIEIWGLEVVIHSITLSVMSDLDSRMLVLHKYNVSIICSMLMLFSEHHFIILITASLSIFKYSNKYIWHYIHTCTTVYYAMNGLPI